MTSGWPSGAFPNPFDPNQPSFPPRPPQPPPPEETNKLATLSVVFAVLLAPVGAVLGHLALRNIRHTGQRGRDRAIVGLSLSYLLTVLAVVGVVAWAIVGTNHSASPTASTAGTSAVAAKPTTPAPPEPSVTNDGLPTLLLTAEQVNAILKSSGIYVNKTWTQTHGPLPGDSFEPAECTDVVFNGLTDTYRNSGYLAISGVDMGEHGNGFPHGISESVASYERGSAAEAFVARIGDTLRGCAGRQLNYIHPGGTGVYTAGTPVESGGITTMRSTLDKMVANGNSSDAKQMNIGVVRGIAAKANVVVDVVLIGRDLGEETTTMVSQILGRIPR